MSASRTDQSPFENLVFVLAPIGRDAFVVQQVLASAGIECLIVDSIADLTARLRDGAGALLLTEEALTPAALTGVRAILDAQPPWSDLPIVLLLSERGRSTAPPLATLSTTRTLIVLERPTPAVTLITATQTALSARARQYEVRDLLDRERQAREHAEETARIKDEFLATVSHELRTPSSAILLWSQLLAAGRVRDAEAVQAARSIAASAQTQSKLIDDLLDQSRMLTGKLHISVKPEALGAILTRAADVMRPTAEVKNINFEVWLTSSNDLVLADADRIQQIVWNLLSNAVKFTPSGGSVSLRLARDDGHLTMTVTDTGEGIAPEDLPSVFARFWQGRRAANQRRTGLGLGLSIAQQLVELHGGTIQAHSAGPGQGAVFTVRLPALEAS